MSFSLKKASEKAPFFLIAGPCVIQTEELCLEIAQTVKNIGNDLNIPVVFKASFFPLFIKDKPPMCYCLQTIKSSGLHISL